MNNSTTSVINTNLKKIIRYIRISLLVNFIITIPLTILAILAIGEKTIFILTIISVGLLCFQFFVLLALDIIRMNKVRKLGTTE